MSKICKNCGEPISSKKDTYLCKKCAKEIKSQSAKKDHICIDCGVSFVGGIRALRCPDCKIAYKREYDRILKQKGSARHIGDIDSCEICGEKYTVNSGQQKYCPTCSEKAVSDKVKKRALDRYHSLKNILNPIRNERRTPLFACPICGEEFEKESASITCSDKCHKILKKYNQALTDYKREKRKTLPESPIKF